MATNWREGRAPQHHLYGGKGSKRDVNCVEIDCPETVISTPMAWLPVKLYQNLSPTNLSGEHERLFVDALFEHGRRLIGHVLFHYLEAKGAKRIDEKKEK